TEEFDPTDPNAFRNGVNCYPFPFPAQTCGAVIAVDVPADTRTLLADFGDSTSADPNLPNSFKLGAWPIAGVLQNGDLPIVDKGPPAVFAVRSPRTGALWRVPTSGADAGVRYILSNFADSTQGPFGIDPFSIARDGAGRIFVLDRAAVGSGIVDCNQIPGSNPDGCGSVFQIDPDGTRHLIT